MYAACMSSFFEMMHILHKWDDDDDDVDEDDDDEEEDENENRYTWN